MRGRLARIACLCVVSLLSITAVACAKPAPPVDVALVHDVPQGHPRLKYFDQFAQTVGASSEGGLVVRVNPQQKVLAGRESLDSVRSGQSQIAAVNMSHLETVEPRVGFMNLPFTLNDGTMSQDIKRRHVADTLAGLVRPHGLELLGVMRGADQLFTFPRDDVRKLEDLKGRKVRVAGPGVYERIMRGLEAEPVGIPIPAIDKAMAEKKVDGIFTSPGGWSSKVQELTPHGIHVPGLMFITYALVVDSKWLESLPPAQREALKSAGNAFTDQWTQMQHDDEAVIADAVARGRTHTVLPDAEVARWKARMTGVTSEFFGAHPDLKATLVDSGILEESP